jgi:hypothetical protein
MNSDFKDLLRAFNDHNVRYLVVGGYAVMKYTEPRYTKDLDIWVEAGPGNSRAVYAALREFGAPLRNIKAADFAREGSIYQMGRPPARVDVLTSIDGVGFADAWPNRVSTEFDGIPAHIISRQDLLTNKQAVGRPEDRLDVANLLNAEKTLKTRKGAPNRKKGRPRGRNKGIDH